MQAPPVPWFTIMYGVLASCVAFPPDAIAQLGLHVDGIWQNWLGSEGLHFVEYHMRRTIATLVTHGILLLLYACGLWYIEPAVRPWQDQDTVRDAALSWVSLLCCVACYAYWGVALLWSWDNYRFHPTRKTLEWYRPGDWERVKRAITAEFRHIDKVSIITGFSRVTVTDSWLLQTNIYLLDVALQSDADFSLVATFDAPKVNAVERRHMVRIRVTTVNPHTPAFDVILDAENYRALSDKLTARIRNSRNLIIRQSLSDQFLSLFLHRVHQNPRYSGTRAHVEDDDLCMGCSLVKPNVKVVCRTPNTDNSNNNNSDCFCRPMFCLDCMGKWFVSSQNQRRPETWLAGWAHCPTCRVQFTVNDLALLETDTTNSSSGGVTA